MEKDIEKNVNQIIEEIKNNFLITSSVAFIGVGQMGGNLAEEFRKLGYTTFYINSSAVDLATIPVDKNQKYQIPLAHGCAKNRGLAKRYVQQYYNIISTLIERKLGNFSHVFICFSAGGGTGGGASPTLLANLAKDNPEITFGAICALPSIKESLKTKYNACECYKELKSIKDLIGNIYFIDNNKTLMDGENRLDVFTLNNIFAESLHRFLCVTSPKTKGIADDQEVLTLLSLSGCVTLADILPEAVIGLTDRRVVPIIPCAECGSTTNQQFGYCISDDTFFLEEEVETLFGKGVDFFKGYTNGESIVAAFGLDFPSRVLRDLSIQYNEDLEVLKASQFEDEENNEIDVILDRMEDPVKATINKTSIAAKANEMLSALLIKSL